MSDTTHCHIFPLYQQPRFDILDRAKYSPPSPTKTSAFGSDSSPLPTHSTTTSSRLSGSYEPSQVGSVIEDNLSRVDNSAMPHQRPIVPPLQMPSQSNQSHLPALQSPYHSFQGHHPYGSYYHPAVSPPPQHYASFPAYPYSPPLRPVQEQFHAVATPPYASPVLYNAAPLQSPPLMHVQRRPSYSGGLFLADYSNSTVPTSPISPFSYYPTTQPFAFHAPGSQTSSSNPFERQPVSRSAHVNTQRPLAVTSPVLPSTLLNFGERSGRSLHSVLQQSNTPLTDRLYRRELREALPPARSALLTDFKNDKTKRWELKDVIGHFTEFSSDQHGSRFIQQRLDAVSQEDRQLVFEEIVPHTALSLMRDVFGNYVVQKLFEYGSALQRTQLFTAMRGSILQLSLDMYGCRVVQKALEFVSVEQQSLLVAELDGHILQCVKDANGNHVIQKLLERVPSEHITLVKAFAGNVLALATHTYGCRVLQRCFEHVKQDQMETLLEELHHHAMSLMVDQFGNYVIQFVLEHGPIKYQALLVESLQGHLLSMARHKYASNVCEKAIISSTEEQRLAFVEEMLTEGKDGVAPVTVLMKDQFGNYVLQKALSVLDGELLDRMVQVVWPQLVSMRRHPTAFTKHLNSIERLLKEKGLQLDSQSLHLSLPLQRTQLLEDEDSSSTPTP